MEDINFQPIETIELDTWVILAEDKDDKILGGGMFHKKRNGELVWYNGYTWLKDEDKFQDIKYLKLWAPWPRNRPLPDVAWNIPNPEPSEYKIGV